MNFWASLYQGRVPALAREAPFTSKDIDFCGDQRSVRVCAERLGGHHASPRSTTRPRTAGPWSSSTGWGHAHPGRRVSASGSTPRRSTRPAFPSSCRRGGGLDGRPLLRDAPVLCVESRVHNVVGLPGAYNTEQGRKQLRVSILFAREFLLDVLDGRIDAEDPARTVLKLNERIFRFSMHDRHAKELYGGKGVDPADAILGDTRLPAVFLERRFPRCASSSRPGRRSASRRASASRSRRSSSPRRLEVPPFPINPGERGTPGQQSRCPAMRSSAQKGPIPPKCPRPTRPRPRRETPR